MPKESKVLYVLALRASSAKSGKRWSPHCPPVHFQNPGFPAQSPKWASRRMDLLYQPLAHKARKRRGELGSRRPPAFIWPLVPSSGHVRMPYSLQGMRSVESHAQNVLVPKDTNREYDCILLWNLPQYIGYELRNTSVDAKSQRTWEGEYTPNSRPCLSGEMKRHGLEGQMDVDTII